MAKPYKLLRDKISPEARQRAKAEAEAILKEMPLHEISGSENPNRMTLLQK